MKIMHVIPAIALIALSACETLPGADAPASRGAHQITTLAEFEQLIVGKLLRYAETNTFTIHADGTMTGDFGGAALEGTWVWEDQYWCRTLTTLRPGTDCQVWNIDGKEITITRDRGNGASVTYALD